MKRATILSLLITLSSCVDHRDLRTEVFNENVYLPKSFLTQENPHTPGSGDSAWLMKSTMVKMSVPSPDLGFYMAFPSETKYVRFQFGPEKAEIVDDKEYAPKVPDHQGQTNVTSPALARAVLNSWTGTHVDIRMKDNLDGERTNVIEENRESPWEDRQYFKVNLAKGDIPDINMIHWAISDYYIGECLKLRSVAVVPDSFELEEQAATGGDDYMSWTVAVTYELAVYGGGYYCGDLFTDITDRSTFTFHIKHAFWRLPRRDYKAVEIKEKDPVQKTISMLNAPPEVFYDPQTALPGARSYLMRFDPRKPHTFYFGESFPDRYKDHFRKDITKQVNDLMQSINVPMRIDFKDWNYDAKCEGVTCGEGESCARGECCSGTDCKPMNRNIGDPRWSMIHYHSVPSTTGIGGMSEITYDPRTGESLASHLNMYDWGAALVVNFVEDYLKEVTPDAFDDKNSPLKTPCKPGDVVALDPKKIEDKHQKTSLYTKLETYMGQKAENWVPKHSADFPKYMRMLLPDLRFAYPGYNEYVYGSTEWQQELGKLEQKDREFRALTASLERGESPFGGTNLLDQGAMQHALDVVKQTKEGLRNQQRLEAFRRMGRRHVMEDKIGWELGPAIARSGRMCKTNGQWETREQWQQRIVDGWFLGTVTHEFGHNLGLGHNFYGSLDKPHFENNDITSSIMEYSYTYADGVDQPQFKPYDRMALKWVYGGVDTTGNGKCDVGENFQTNPKECQKQAGDELWLFCDDEHTYFSPLCTWHDIGTTPTEIIKNEIDKYEWQYKFRNFRAYRKFWNTLSYSSRIGNTLYPLRRFLHLWGVDWYGSNIKNNLMLLGVKGDEYFFNSLTDEFNDEMGQANRLTANFYKAILQQSAGERSYATKFDSFYGDVTQQGIIMDKYYAMLLFLGLWPIDDYDQNIYAYMAFHEYSLGNAQFYSDTQEITDSMIGGQYDVYPWFKPLAVLVFAQDTGDINFSDRSKQKWIEMKRFSQVQNMVDYYGFDPRTEALTTDNPYQVFKDQDGAQWIYYFVQDRNEHLTASKDKNPTAFKIIWDQNESINVNKYGSTDDFEIKYYCDYYNYFN